MGTVAILGAGVMGETLLSGLVRAGRRVDQLMVGEKRPERARELEERYGVAVVSNREAAAKADTVALVVKPQDMGDVLAEIAPDLRPGQLLVSLAAGITTAFIESRVPDGVAVSEAVALATELSTDESPRFVNGLLSRLAELKPSLSLSGVDDRDL